MRFKELQIQTRREAPAQARTLAEAILIRAGFVDGNGVATPLGLRTIGRLTETSTNILEVMRSTGLEVAKLESGRVMAGYEAGEETLLSCPSCGYAAEAPLARFRKNPPPLEAPLPLTKVPTPASNTIEALAAFLQIPRERTAKAMMYTRLSDEAFVFAAIRGDMQISQPKLEGLAGRVRTASLDEIIAAGATPGYASPIGLRRSLIIIDDLVADSSNLVVGANEPGFHYLNANFRRDFEAEIVKDIALAEAGDPCWRCGNPLESLQASLVVDEAGIQPRSVLITLASKHIDERGLCWPRAVAPFDVHLVALSSKTVDTAAVCDRLCSSLEMAGISVLYDDRDVRAGVKFNDADLIGCPVRITVGEKKLQNGMIELKRREKTEVHDAALGEATERVRALLGDADA